MDSPDFTAQAIRHIEEIVRAGARGLKFELGKPAWRWMPMDDPRLDPIYTRAGELGLRVRLHAEQLANIGGSRTAAHHRALSVDHLEFTSESDVAALAAAGTVAVLLDAIRGAGRAAASHELHGGGGIDELTSREMEILRLMQQGVSNKTISRELGIELSTVKNHVHSILAKLGVHRRGEAISLLYAHEKAVGGWDVLPTFEPSDVDDLDDDLSHEALLA